MRIVIKHILISTLLLALNSVVFAGTINLNTWSQQGVSSNGNWQVSTDGSSVLQTINGDPTIFTSPDSFINSEFNGSFGVETTSDDDFIGFVFGFNGLDDFYLFDWKQNSQSLGSVVGNEGFTLSKISTGADINNFNNMWSHSGSGISVLASDYGSDRGWADNISYNFTLGYSATEINIRIDGGAFDDEQIFSLSGLSNQAGKFGFYNLSQQNVRYSGFTEDVCSENCSVDVPEPSSLAILALGLIGFRLRKIVNS